MVIQIKINCCGINRHANRAVCAAVAGMMAAGWLWATPGMGQRAEKWELLRQQQVSPADFEDLRQLLQFWTRVGGGPVLIDPSAQEDEGLTLDSRFNVDQFILSDGPVSYEALLDAVLGMYNCTFAVTEQWLVIRSKFADEYHLETRVIDARPLLQWAVRQRAARGEPPDASPPAPGPGGLGDPGGFFGGPGGTVYEVLGPDAQTPETLPLQASAMELRAAAEELMQLVQRTIEPDSWAISDGVGAILQYNGFLVVSNTSRIAEQTERMIRELQEKAIEP